MKKPFTRDELLERLRRGRENRDPKAAEELAKQLPQYQRPEPGAIRAILPTKRRDPSE